MPLKYQTAIDKFKMNINCPEEVESPQELEVYRWSFNPINHELNFLPNVVFDEKIKSSYNYAKKDHFVICSRCGSSYFKSKDAAIAKWDHLTIEIKRSMGYTNLAVGVLSNDDGLMKKPDRDGHFTFYENEGVDLTKKFTIDDKLTIEDIEEDVED